MSSNSAVEEKIDPRVKRTRALIQQAFLELFGEKEFEAITIQDITQKAEINRATFYAHYPDKFALLETSIHHIFQQELEKRTLNACRYSDQNLHALIVTVCEFIANANSRCKISSSQFETLIEKQVRNQIQELLEFWQRQMNTTLEPEMAAIVASWAIYGLALHWNHDKNHPPVEAYADQILPLIIPNLHLKSESEFTHALTKNAHIDTMASDRGND
ncbi:MAG: TetR/AcrR family transcriptional regulator [Anaerolineaceae bacterium]